MAPKIELKRKSKAHPLSLEGRGSLNSGDLPGATFVGLTLPQADIFAHFQGLGVSASRRRVPKGATTCGVLNFEGGMGILGSMGIIRAGTTPLELV